MSYTPTEWKTGDVITAEKLNNMEQGIKKSGIVVTYMNADKDVNTNTFSNITLDKSYEELADAGSRNGTVFFVVHIDRYYSTSKVGTESFSVFATAIGDNSVVGGQYFSLNNGMLNSYTVGVNLETGPFILFEYYTVTKG